MRRLAEEDYEREWGSKLKIPTAADGLGCFWYVEHHTATEIKFKFDFDSPNSVSSGAYGQDEIMVKIKDLS